VENPLIRGKLLNIAMNIKLKFNPNMCTPKVLRVSMPNNAPTKAASSIN
jgi:hypothetical protein